MKRPHVRILIVILLMLAGGGALLHPLLFTGLATAVVADDPPEPADLILPLFYEGPSVARAAARLYHRGYAKRVVLQRMRAKRLETLGLMPPAHDVGQRLLELESVPPEAIDILGEETTSELDLGRALAAFATRRNYARVLVVASAPFSRLSRHNLQRGLGTAPVTLHMHAVPLTSFNERNWWKFRRGWVTYFDAYCLWLLRFLR